MCHSYVGCDDRALTVGMGNSVYHFMINTYYVIVMGHYITHNNALCYYTGDRYLIIFIFTITYFLNLPVTPPQKAIRNHL